MLEYLILIPLAPLVGFAIVGLLGSSGLISDKTGHRVAVTASALALLVTLLVAVDFAGGIEEYADRAANAPGTYEVVVGSEDEPARFEKTYAEWLPLGDTILRGWGADGRTHSVVSVGWTLQVDALTLVMLLVVTFVGTLIHVYSIGYMEEEKRTFRFFCYLNLFMAMMLTLVLAGNILVMFVGWEGVGLCSYLLIGYYYDRPFDKESGLTCADAGRKAFITNRIGDFGFLIGALLLLITFGTFDFSEIAGAINAGSAFWYDAALLTGIGVLLFVGATGKSAQMPLYVWLPDAMAGPTPVSALIHAATMVTAGVYMLARMSALYWHAPGAMLVVAVVGCLTAVFAATMGFAQYDIKKVLAYSTVSQLGYMFLGAGVGAFVAAIFHLATHAFFKACLFLGSGSVIARCGHSNDMRLYGGLKKWMPITYATFLAATLAITGLPLLSGFMSKDEILAKTLFSTRGHMLLWVFGTLGAVMTSFYMFRAVWMTFHGENRSPEHVRSHLKESPWTMTSVLVVLAIGSVLLGFVGVPEGVSKLVGVGNVNWFEHQVHPVVAARGVVAAPAHHGDHGTDGAHGEHAVMGAAHVIPEGLDGHPTYLQEWGLFLLGLLVFLLGLGIASWTYGGNMRWAQVFEPLLRYPRRVLHRKWFVDELYLLLVIHPFYALCRGFARADEWVVDGIVNGVAKLTLWASYIKAFLDKWVVDLAVNAIAWLIGLGGAIMRRLQVGYVQSYAALIVFGTLALLTTYLFFFAG